jgi:hypothetical protein
VELKRALSGALRVEFGEVNIDAACSRYAESGYEVTPWLRSFLENYSEITVVWRSSHNYENELTTSVDIALEAYPRNVRNYAMRIGHVVVPVGMAFATEERLLLAENGDVLLGGDAGLQRVGSGFEDAVQSLIANDWDKTFF